MYRKPKRNFTRKLNNESNFQMNSDVLVRELVARERDSVACLLQQLLEEYEFGDSFKCMVYRTCIHHKLEAISGVSCYTDETFCDQIHEWVARTESLLDFYSKYYNDSVYKK